MTAPRYCPVCGNRNDGGGTEPGCNPHNCPSWRVTHIYDRKTGAWAPVPDPDHGTEADQ